LVPKGVKKRCANGKRKKGHLAPKNLKKGVKKPVKNWPLGGKKGGGGGGANSF